MSTTRLMWMLAICLTLLSCGQSNRDVVKATNQSTPKHSENIAVVEPHRHFSADDLRQIATDNLHVGLGMGDACKALRAHDLSVVVSMGSGVSAKHFFSNGNAPYPVLVVTYRRKRKECRVIEWAVEEKSPTNEE